MPEETTPKKKRMKTSSAKAKGRRLQQLVRDFLREIGKDFGLEDGDIESRGMGQNGEDVILSPAARRVFGPLYIECKNVEKLQVVPVFLEHANKYADKGLPILVHAKNRTAPMVTLPAKEFFEILEKIVRDANTRKIGFNSKKTV